MFWYNDIILQLIGKMVNKKLILEQKNYQIITRKTFFIKNKYKLRHESLENLLKNKNIKELVKILNEKK